MGNGRPSSCIRTITSVRNDWPIPQAGEGSADGTELHPGDDSYALRPYLCRRANRDEKAHEASNNEEDIEVKRARGEISWQNCCRLKLKCDKKLPCGSCVRRGCTSICPNGSLSAGQGTRFILADTEQLHRKIAEMSERIRQLEDTVAIFQAGVSNERHPLLRDDLLSIKFGPEVRRTVDDEHRRETLSSAIDALGTLTIGSHGETKYFGRSGGSETNMPNDEEPVENPEAVDDVPELPAELANLHLAFPLSFSDEGHERYLDQLEALLPMHPRASALCEAYLAHFTWYSRPIKRDELIDDILTPIYNSMKTNASGDRTGYRAGGTDSSRCPHLLAVLYLVLAIGALVDLTMPPCSAEAEKYYRLGRIALSMRSILDSPEIETVQAVTLMAAYHSLCTLRYSIESAWTLASLATKLAQSVHRDSKQWKMEEKNVQRRRNLFWEIFVLELIHCIALGRPPSINLAHIDCELPTDEDAAVADNGDTMQGYWHFKMLFSRDIYSPIVESMLAAKGPTYNTILDLDRRIRQMTLPPIKLYLRPDDDDYNNPALCMKSYLMSHYRSLTMIHIHRTFFAQALLDNPNSPLSSPYAPSFLAANRCASILLKSFIHHHERCSELCGRFWGMWTHAFSAAIIIGATVIRMPQSSLTPSALMELDLAVGVFEKGAVSSLRARQGLPILRKIRDRAKKAYEEYRDRHLNPATNGTPAQIPEEYQQALAIFGGQTRVLPSRALSRRRQRKSGRATTDSPWSASQASSQHSPTSSSSAVTPPPAQTPSDSSGGSPSPEFQPHPALMMYLSQVPSNSPFQSADLQALQVPSCPPPAPAPVPPFPTVPTPDHNHTLIDSYPQGAQADLDFLNSLLSNPQYQSVPTFPNDAVMSDQWMSLMQETGLFEGMEGIENDTFTPNLFSF
ncbi:fungal-specific transcription factor domain-containing protein [Fomitopsis serialis]|uniref:fungal-specific transcription factor domain-containing protein n=1 Tax=Fomitopsis serialis TaxID=139415 RepID=UPI00200836DF|nr:fungal-specific transcription factor domain-containing protein [Neoantrodia serialis]KAH9926912.1 fungal-specific transcription factor domain-containing protein [Neoantrodia serialis]